MSLSQIELKQKLHYSPETGVFTIKMGTRIYNIGDIAGNMNSRGYLLFNIGGSARPLHRLAFLYMEGVLPESYIEIDHINGNKLDNRWSNLRKCSHAENCRNKPKGSNNTSGIKGVHKQYDKYQARLKVDGIHYSAGVFETKEEAEQAIVKLRVVHHKEFARNE